MLVHTCALANQVESFEQLRAEGVIGLEDVRSSDNKAAKICAAKGHLRFLQALVGAGLTCADLRAGDNCAVRTACANGHTEVVRYLLADLQVAADQHALSQCLQGACRGGHVDVARVLLAMECVSLAAIRADQNEALRLACRSGKTEMVKGLVARGLALEDACEPHVVDEWGRLELVQFLVSALGPLPDADLSSAIQAAHFRGRWDVVRFLKEQLRE